LRALHNPYAGGGCFFCGRANPIGLHLTFYETDGDPPELLCRWTPTEAYRGLGRVLHGGIQCGLFDEIMGWATHHLTGESAVTGGLEVRFLRPVLLGREVTVRCRITEIAGRKVHLAAELRDPEGEVRSRATGYYVMVPAERFRELMEP
jgi:acyl-coenzyme A thioesterase PaaI-like protein